MDLREIGWEGMDWIHLGQDRDQWGTLLNTVMNLWVLQKVGNFLTSCDYLLLKKDAAPWNGLIGWLVG
jgi:hypothetical protein